MKMKGFLAGAAAVLFAAGVAGAANLSLLSGPQDPSQLLATINQLVQNINFGVSGRLSANGTASGTTTTIESTMMTYSLPANRLAADGDSVRAVCWGTSATNANTKSARLYVGSDYISTSTISDGPSNRNWRLDLTIMRTGAAAQQVMGNGVIAGLTPTIYITSGALSFASSITIKCAGYTPTAAQDLTARGMLVEQIK